MKVRTVFITEDLPSARRAIEAALRAGAKDEDLSLVARADIQMEDIPSNRLDVATDFVPAALRGAGTGGAIGLVAGLVGMVIPPIGLTVAGAALLTMTGVSVGGWLSSLVGSSIADPVRRKFEAEIESGRILVILDADQDRSSMIGSAMTAAGAPKLPFEESSSMV
ncbi:MAG: hypothetical protein ABI304_00770 [Rudaea sp.]